MASVRERISGEVAGWPGVEERPHRFAGVEFRVNGHEIGHLHGEGCRRWRTSRSRCGFGKSWSRLAGRRFTTSCHRPGG